VELRGNIEESETMDHETTKMEVTKDIENGGETEKGAELPHGQTTEVETEIRTERSENKHTGVRKGGKYSIADLVAVANSTADVRSEGSWL
jgi:hypothetical protein